MDVMKTHYGTMFHDTAGVNHTKKYTKKYHKCEIVLCPLWAYSRKIGKASGRLHCTVYGMLHPILPGDCTFSIYYKVK